MTIESIELKNYRNYEELHMELSQGTNILYGDNAQGKTNILEAVYVCCTTKSHRGAKDRDMIRFGEDESHIKLQIKKGAVPCRDQKGQSAVWSCKCGVFLTGRLKYH